MMNSSLRIAIAITAGVLCSAASAVAQSMYNEPGQIGKRYAGGDYTYDNYHDSALDHAHGVTGYVNLPVNAAGDVNFSYAYADAEGGPGYSAIGKGLSGSYVVHEHTQYGTGYFAATLGHGWDRVKVAGIESRDNHTYWGVRAGYEMPVGRRTAINAGISYADAFKDGASLTRYYVEANHWFSRELAGVLSASYKQIQKSPDAVSYTAGLRWAF
jgi:hypothetical protein